MNPNLPCPCHSGTRYANCCGPFHQGAREPPDAEAMMRSRYAAFALRKVEYLYRTLHATHEDKQRPERKVLGELREAAESFRYMGLQVLDRSAPDAAGVARVVFYARLFERGRDRSFVELSEFRHDGVGWRYATGRPVPARSVEGGLERLTIATFPGAIATPR